MSERLVARGLLCMRDRRRLFGDLDLALDAGSALLVEGVNGAGKTSLLRLLCGLAEPHAGSVHWRGEDIRRCRIDYHAELLYLGHQPALKDDLTALENLQFYQSLAGGPAADPDAALAAAGLEGLEERTVRRMSAGQRRRVALARLWLESRHTLWILDEPFTALDVAGIRNLTRRLEEHLGRGGVAVVTSHQPLSLPGLQRLAL